MCLDTEYEKRNKWMTLNPWGGSLCFIKQTNDIDI